MESAPSTVRTVTLPDAIRGLRERVAAWGGQGVLPTVLVLLLWGRIGQIGLRMERMMARFRAGRLWRRAPRTGEMTDFSAAAAPVCVVGPGAAREPCGVEARGRPVRSKRVWPSRFGWLVRACGYEAAGLSEQLRFVLTQPEMVALLAAAPRARRVLLPLCRALMIESSVLRPGLPVPPPREKAVRVKRVRKPREKIDWGRIPLPRGMLSAARRAGFGKLR